MISWPTRLSLILLLLAAGCSSDKTKPPDVLYQAAQRELRLGRLDSALTQTEDGLQGAEPDSAWQWRFLVLKAEILTATGKPEQAIKLLEKKPPAGRKSPDLLARLTMNEGYAELRMAKFQEAKRLLDEAYRYATKSESPLLIAEVENRRGAALARLYDPAGADECFRNALKNATAAGDAYQEMSALGNLGMSRLAAYRADEAIPYFEQVLPRAEKSGYGRTRAATIHNLGTCYAMLGDFQKALKLLSQAEKLHAANGDNPRREGCLGDMGAVYQGLREYDSAISCYRTALQLAKQQQDRLYEADWLISLATTSLDAGELTSAESFNRQAIALLESMHEGPRQVLTTINSARIATVKGEYAEAVKMYGSVIDQARKEQMLPPLLEALARLGSLYARTGEWKKAEIQFRELASAIEQNRTKLRRDEWKLAFQSSIIPFYQDYVDLLMERGRTSEALQVTESCRAQVLADKLGLERAGSLPTVASFQSKARAEKAVMLSYWLAPRRSFLWAIAPGKVSAFVLPPEKEIKDLIAAYTNMILDLRDPLQIAPDVAQRLYAILVAPASELIPRNSRVIVVPDGPLYALNFETLLTGGDHPRYWIEDVNIASAPSLSVLRTDQPKREPQGLLLIGNPLSPSQEFPKLPDAEAEIQAIARSFPARRSDVITGAAAQPNAYKDADPGQFAVIHFSAHAVANPESPLDSAVILSRSGDSYKLYARDVTRIPLQADLVTISACRSAGARLYSGEGLVGFSWAFLQAGARNVVAGLWDVNDRSTALLMSRLYEEMKDGKGPAEALRAAKLSFLNEPTYRRPYHWAPFELFTRSTPFSRRPG